MLLAWIALAILGIAVAGFAVFQIGKSMSSPQTAQQGQNTSQPNDKNTAANPHMTESNEQKSNYWTKIKEYIKQKWRRIVEIVEKSDKAIVALSTAVIATFTIALAFATAFLFISSERVADAARKSADAAKQSADALVTIERPYLFMDTPTFGEGISGLPKIDFSLINYGRTPAILRFYVGRVYTSESPKQFMAITAWNGWEVLKPGDSHMSGRTGRSFQLNKKIDDPKTRLPDAKKTPLLWVEVSYLDVFNYMHTAGFSFFYMDDGSGGKFVAIAGEKYNYRRADPLPEGDWHPKPSEPPTD
jgi:hypothetical protein